MRDVRADEASRVKCPEHPRAEITEEAKPGLGAGIIGAGGAWVYLFCGECNPEYFSSAIARYYVR